MINQCGVTLVFTAFIKSYEIGIGGGNYKKTFFEEFVAKNLQKD